jgi:RNA polymerase sigma-70 factor (ECF subfamily)
MGRSVEQGSLQAILDKVNRGDPLAAEQLYTTVFPYLRMVVRRTMPPPLRAKFDSSDVVQSAWVKLLDGIQNQAWHFDDVRHLQAFLKTVVLNHFLNRVRRANIERETLPLSPSNRDPSPSDEAKAEELWRQLLELCPAQHHDVLRYKLEGMTLEEIAARTGLHPSSVRRILYELSRRLTRRRGLGPNAK